MIPSVAFVGEQHRVAAATEMLGWQVLEAEADLLALPWAEWEPLLAQGQLVLVTDVPPAAIADVLRSGADEAVGADVSVAELAARMEALVRRARSERDRSPLTGLPGAARLEQVVRDRLEDGQTPALLLLDIDTFKSFNDRYGHWRGDGLIQMLATVAVQAAETDENALVTHIGGDDLCIVTRPALVDEIGRECVRAFDDLAPEHYDEADRRRGYVVTRSRTGQRKQFGLTTLTAVAATAEAEDIEHFGQLFGVLAELKDYAKGKSGSTYFRDRRRYHGWLDAQGQQPASDPAEPTRRGDT